MSSSQTKSSYISKIALLTSLMGFAACAPKNFEPSLNSPSSAQTGHTTPDGRKYTVGRETRLSDEKRKIQPQQPANPTPKEQQQLNLNQSLKNFHFIRFDKQSQRPSRLGSDHFEFQLVVKEPHRSSQKLSFTGSLHGDQNGEYQIKPTQAKENSQYELTGRFKESRDATSGDRVVGQFKVKFLGQPKAIEATILYRAYEANLNIRAPLSKNLEENVNLAKNIQNLQTNTKAWVNDFSVPLGVSTYDIAVIKKASPTPSPESTEEPGLESLLSFSGDSIETGFQDIEPAQIQSAANQQDLESVELVGNAEGEDSRIFMMTVKDDKGEDTELMVDIESESPATDLTFEQDPPTDIPTKEAPAQKESEMDVELTQKLPEVNIPIPQPRPDDQRPQRAQPSRTESARTQSAKGNNSRSYLYTESGSEALKIIHDFDQNYHLPTVQKYIADFKKRGSGRNNKIKNFFKYANPFRGLIEKIARGFKVPAQFAYVSLIESRYFYGGRYELQVNPHGDDTGPFQIISSTGKWLGMKIYPQAKGSLPDSRDERLYFASSACGAAKLFKENSNYLPKDKTLTILSYNRGAGGAAKMALCSKGQCGLSANRALKMARDYSYTFQAIEKHKIDRDAINYVSRVLAAYFVAGEYEGSPLDMDANAPSRLPSRTVFPSNYKDSKCAQIL